MITLSFSTLFTAVMSAACANTLNTINPIKMSFVLLLTSASVFCYLGLTKGVSWLFTLMLMLFMGGIMIVFMIVSSLSPNEPSLMLKTGYFIVMCLLFWPVASMSSDSASQLKWFSLSSRNIQMMTTIIISYFIAFIWIVSMEKGSMRAWEACRSMKIFCKNSFSKRQYYR